MSSVRTQLFLITFTICLVFLSFGGLALITLQNAYTINTDVNQSSEIQYLAYLIVKNKNSKEYSEKILKAAEHVKPDFRKSNIEKFTKSPSESRLRLILDTEHKMQTHYNKAHKYLLDRAKYHGIIAITFGVIMCIFAYIYTFRKIFSPLNVLIRRMSDFLSNRYSYEFSVPDDNEVGDLHSAFNALAQKVLHQIEDLKSLDKAKTEFLSIASHELRTPLTSIKGSLSLMHAGVVEKLNDKSKNLLTIALNETDRLIRLINELLDLAKIEARKFEINLSRTSFNDLVHKTILGLDGLAKSANVKLESEVDGLVDVNMDSDRIQQVLTNLLSNAIKFSPVNSKVKIKVSADHLSNKNGIKVEIIDQGRGIAPEDLQYMFKKFSQASNAQNPLVKGTGLGLAIAKALVEEHGGEIGVLSVPNQGSTFWFTLPDAKISTHKKEAS